MSQEPLTFNELVDELAGYALTTLVTGKTTWRSIIFYVVMAAAQWANAERDRKDAIAKALPLKPTGEE